MGGVHQNVASTASGYHTQVKRIVDKEANALVYVSYSTRINKDDDSNKARFASSLCTVSMD